MTESDTVARALNLLASRLNELERVRLEVEVESRKIHAAMQSLTGNGVSVASDDEPRATPIGSAFQPVFTPEATRLSVRAAVRQVLDSENRSFTPEEVQDRLDPAVLGTRNDRQRRNVIRTSLLTLRRSGHAYAIDGDRTLSARWVDPQTDEGSSAPTEEPSFTPNDHEGGGESGDLPADSNSQGHDPHR